MHPTNCPLCRKGFNPERIKKLHVDKVNGDGSGPAGAKLEEYEFFRRIAVLFDHRSEPEEINALVEEVNAWVARSTRLSEVSGSEVTVSVVVCARYPSTFACRLIFMVVTPQLSRSIPYVLR